MVIRQQATGGSLEQLLDDDLMDELTGSLDLTFEQSLAIRRAVLMLNSSARQSAVGVIASHISPTPTDAQVQSALNIVLSDDLGIIPMPDYFTGLVTESAASIALTGVAPTVNLFMVMSPAASPFAFAGASPVLS